MFAWVSIGFFFFRFIGEGVPSSRVCYCVGPGDASECLYLGQSPGFNQRESGVGTGMDEIESDKFQPQPCSAQKKEV